MASLFQMRSVVIAVSLAVLAAACGSGDASRTTSTTAPPPPAPPEIVRQWLDAVIASDGEALSRIVEPEGQVILAAIENGFTEESIAALLEGGIPAELGEEYWTSFRAGFADVAGFPLQSLQVGATEEFTLGDDRYAAVVITSGDGMATVLTRRRDQVWRLDLIGSFGPAFAAQLRRMLVNLSGSSAADRIRDAYRRDVVPSLLAAARREPGNRVLLAELERMALLLEG